MFDFILSYLGKFLLFSALSEALRPKNRARNPAGTLKDISFPTVDPTRPIQWLIGKRLIDNPNLFGTFDFKGVERSRKEKSGIFSSTRIPLPPEYYISAGMVLCGGSGARLREVWVGDRLAWTGNAASGSLIPLNVSWTEDGQEDAPRGIKGTLEFHSGDTAPSAYLVAKRGAGNVPAWPHLTYVVLRGSDGASGAWIGTSKQVEQVKCVVERMPTALSTGLGEPADGGNYWSVDGDANPAYAAAEVIVDKDYGAGIAPELLDAQAFHRAAKVLFDESHGTSQLWDSQRVSGDVVLELCRQAGMLLQPEPVNGLQVLRVLRATDEPVITLDASNIKRIDEFSRSAMDEQTNTMALEYTARDEKWEQRPVEVQDLAAIEVAGQVIPGTATYAGITNANLAGVLAMRDLRAISAPLATARVSAIVPKKQRFMPGDAVLFTSAKHGVVSLRMRVTSARYSRPGEALCELELVEDVFRSGEAVYSVPAPVGGSGGSGGSGSTPAPGVVNAGLGALLMTAPYALTLDDADHGMHVAFAPDANTTSYDLGWYQADPAAQEYHSRRPSFSAFGTLSGALADITAPASLVVNISAAAAATLRAFGNRSVFFYIDTEMLQAAGVTVNTAGTQATLTGVSRGLWDTVPYKHAANAAVVMLCDYAIDPARMRTTVKNGASTVVAFLDGQTELRAVAYGRNLAGVAAGGTAATYYSDDGWTLDTGNGSYARAALPYTPGAVKLAGVVGSSTQAGAPAIVSSGGTLGASWALRNKLAGGLLGWSGSGTGAEPGVKTQVRLEYWNGSSWISYSATADEGATAAALPAPGASVPKPTPLRLTVTPIKVVTGVGIFYGREQVWYWTMTA